jgi:hypothetical protein
MGHRRTVLGLGERRGRGHGRHLLVKLNSGCCTGV